MTVKMLSYKLAMLLLLISGERTHTVHLFDVCNMILTDGSATFIIGDQLKTSSPCCHLGQVVYHEYPHVARLCVIKTLKGIKGPTLVSFPFPFLIPLFLSLHIFAALKSDHVMACAPSLDSP